MVRVWNQCILATAKGKTAGTFDEIGTITIKKGANYILGFYAQIVNTKPTADEASSPRLRVSSTDLGVSGLNLHGGMQGGEGMAAHQASHTEKTFIPWSPKKTGQDLWFAEIKFEVSSIIACTEGFDCGIQLVTSDQQLTDFQKMLYLNSKCGGFTGGDVAIEAAGAGNSAALAAWGTSDADMAVIDANASELVGINYTINLNAETAGVPLCNYAELTCSDINDFPPQQHLVNLGASGSLGTVIDSMREYKSSYHPFIFDKLPASKVKIAISDINSLTGLTAGDGILAVVFK